MGAGPAGLAAAVQAAARGRSHVLLERARLANTVHRYQRGKWVMAEPPELPLQPDLTAGFVAGSREDVLERWANDVREAGALLFAGPQYEVDGLEGAKGDFRLKLRGGAVLLADNVVLAIGVQGNLRTFGVQGDELPHVTYQLDDPAAYTGRRVVVVGVGDAGIENALALAENGNEVAMVNRRSEIDRAKPRNRSLVEAAIRSGAVQYHINAVTERFEPSAIVLQTKEGELRLDADLVIGRLGAIPPRRLLESFGVEFPSDDPAAVPELTESYESNVRGLHVIGALGGYPLIKNCMNQGYEVVEHILGNPVTPSDEIVLREKFAGIEGEVSEILERIRAQIPLFRGLTRVQLREFMFDSDILRVPAGEVIFHRNDFSNTLLSILEGSVDIELPASDRDADSDDRGPHAMRRVALRRGDFFGELGLISGRRRSGTALAVTDCVLIESRRLLVNKLIRSVDEVRAEVDRALIQRTVRNLAPSLSSDDWLEATATAEVRTYKPGEVLFQQGDEPDGLHVIRRGSVTVSVDVGGRDTVIQYVQAGNYLGEMALIGARHERTATARASGLTETVLLKAESVERIMQHSPELRRKFEDRASDQLLAEPRSRGARSNVVRFLLEKGAHEATDLLLIDESLCIRCDNCEKACADTHGGITRLDREAGPTYGSQRGAQLHIPTACQHCEHPKCMDDCPPDALRRNPSGEVYIMDNCIGCGNCVTNCPYDVIRLSPVEEYKPRGLLARLLFGGPLQRERPAADETAHSEIATKCDLCRNLEPPRSGRSRAACVSACPTGAIVRVDPRAIVDEILDRPEQDA